MPAGHRGARGQEAAQRNEQTAAGKLGGMAVGKGAAVGKGPQAGWVVTDGG
jgi:hypothetical protein